MRPSIRLSPFLAAAIAITFSQLASSQTSSPCNPLKGSCAADPALGKSVSIDFTHGPSDSFTAQGKPTYDSNGAAFTIANPGDSPQLISNKYIMFGHVEFVIKAAPGVGIVSSAVLQSDALDEIDWEWLGADNAQVQSNYFGKGQVTTYNRGAFHPDPNNQNGFHTYTIDWTADQIVWQIDGKTVRALPQSSAAAGQYPQTPMMIKVGAWSGGDASNNAPGTIQWAGGLTNFAGGPYTMYVKSIAATDYSTGTQYTYSGTSGSWESIQAANGKVNPGGGSGSSAVDSSAPAVTSSSNSAPIPFEGTHRSDSTYATPSVYPWVASATTLQTSTVSATNYPNLPSGWTVSSSGKVIPPSAAPSTSLLAPSTLSPADLPQASTSAAGSLEIITTYDQRGFPTVVTLAAGATTAPKSYNEQGFLITTAPVVPRSSPTAVAESQRSSSAQVMVVSSSAAAGAKGMAKELGAACGILVAAIAL